jgi:uncharacterized MnhB-related membrane protein
MITIVLEKTGRMNADLPVERQGWDYQLAKGISYLFSPPLVLIAGIIITAAAIGTRDGWYWTLFYGMMSVVIPTLYILWLLSRGEITDFHIRIRKQRIKPFTISTILGISAWFVMLFLGAPDVLLILGAAGMIQLTFLLLITLRWKMSGHSTTISAWAVFLIWLFGISYWPVLLSIPLVAWARVRTDRHEILQTIIGALVGIIIMLIAFYLMSIYTQGMNI